MRAIHFLWRRITSQLRIKQKGKEKTVKKLVKLLSVITMCLVFTTAYASDWIDAEKVVSWESTETGLYLYFEDGTGYYFEINK